MAIESVAFVPIYSLLVIDYLLFFFVIAEATDGYMFIMMIFLISDVELKITSGALFRIHLKYKPIFFTNINVHRIETDNEPCNYFSITR